MPFREIRGQARAVAQLRQAWAGGRLAQAYCFIGPAGVGRRRTALALAQAVNCLAPTAGDEGPDACGECRACRRIAAGRHPDVALVGPEDKSVITIDQIRAVSAGAALKPHEAARKVWILDPADAMQEPAANAFLKTLEEPAGASLFVLLVTLPDSLLPTVRSRCQEVRFGLLPEADLAALLLAAGRTPAEAEAAAALAGGSAERALALEPGEYQELEGRVVGEVWEALGSLLPTLEQAERLAKDRAGLEAALAILLNFTRDLAVAKVGGEARRLLRSARRAAAEQHAAGLSMAAILQVHAAQAEAERALARNANPRLTAERMLLRMRAAIGQG
ncbi:MAG TPA: DNA polymerase III subunit delta' [Candidatus Sulfotelmatobacter sp.]|nr:DNA polymerase III subunit delta' [Candidatus Sulfotelmatobacter sp.]